MHPLPPVIVTCRHMTSSSPGDLCDLMVGMIGTITPIQKKKSAIALVRLYSLLGIFQRDMVSGVSTLPSREDASSTLTTFLSPPM